MAQDEWLHVFILVLLVLETKPRTSGSTTEPLPQPPQGGSLVRGSTIESHPSPYWEVVGRGSTSELHPLALLCFESGTNLVALAGLEPCSPSWV